MAELSGWLDGRRHIFPVRVYYEDTDAGGVVYHANYLRFAERARSELMRLVCDGQRALRDRYGVLFVVRNCEIDYHAPARLDDSLEVETRIVEVGGASLRAEQLVRRSGATLARLLLRLVCLTPEMRVARLPAPLRRALDQLLEG